MTVKELITALKECDQNKEVSLEALFCQATKVMCEIGEVFNGSRIVILKGNQKTKEKGK